MKRRVVVTGIGLVTPLGIGTEQTWSALLNGQSGVGPITRFDASDQASQIAAEVKGFNPEDWFEKKQAKNLDAFVQYAVAAADIAWKNSGLSITDEATCFKLSRTDLLRELGLTCTGFEFCPEVTAKLGRRKIKIVEVPIAYTARAIEEGKKVRWTDGVEALWVLVKYRVKR